MINDVQFYFRLLVKRSLVMIAFLVICTVVGALMAIRLPATYSTSATLIMENAQIPNNFVVSTVQTDTLEQLEIIQQRLMTRANLIDVARRNEVFPNQSRMRPDDVVSQMRARTSIRRSAGRNRATLLTVGFEGSDPQKIAAVVDQYVTIILSTNASFRAASAENTLEFFEQEVSTLDEQMARQSASIVSFKNENSEALPENLSFRLERQSFLQERLSRFERDLEEQRAQRQRLANIQSEEGAIADISSLSPQRDRSDAEVRLARLRDELRQALVVYSEQNPKVRLLQNRIESAEAQVEREQAQSGSSGNNQERSPRTAVEVALAEIDARIASTEQDISDTQAELERVNESIQKTPSNRIALEALERDLENTRSLYNSAVQRLNQARMGERVETSARGERITVLEPAVVPTRPSGPNRAAIGGMGVMVGLGLAAGWFLLLELLNQTIRRPAELTRALNVAPLMTLPHYEAPRDRRRRHLLRVVAAVLCVAGTLAGAWAIDTYYMPLDQLILRLRSMVL